MRFNSRGDSLAGYAGVTSVEETEDGGVILRGEPDGVRISAKERGRLAAFINGGEAELFDHDENAAAEEETPADADKDDSAVAGGEGDGDKSEPKKPTIPKKTK